MNGTSTPDATDFGIRVSRARTAPRCAGGRALVRWLGMAFRGRFGRRSPETAPYELSGHAAAVPRSGNGIAAASGLWSKRGRLQGTVQLALIVVLVVVCGPAEAQTANPFADALKIILGFFDNAVVTGVGTVAIIVVAFLCARGRMEWMTGSVVIFAIAVMIGAPKISELVVGGG